MNVCEILSNLWVGNKEISMDKNFLKLHDINIVINCTPDLPFRLKNIKNIRIPLNDNLEKKDAIQFYRLIDKILKIIHKNLYKCNNILVHCYGGKQRSCSVICAYLIKYGKMSYKDSINAIKSKYTNAFNPCVNLDHVLKLLEKRKNDVNNYTDNEFLIKDEE